MLFGILWFQGLNSIYCSLTFSPLNENTWLCLWKEMNQEGCFQGIFCHSILVNSASRMHDLSLANYRCTCLELITDMGYWERIRTNMSCMNLLCVWFFQPIFYLEVPLNRPYVTITTTHQLANIIDFLFWYMKISWKQNIFQIDISAEN